MTQWVAVAIAIVAAIAAPAVGAASYLPIFALALVLAFTQGIRRYGWTLLTAFFVIAFVLSNFWENLSIATGFPFGHYFYTMGPRLFEVPVMIGIIYFGLGYISWMTANVALDRADERLDLRTRSGKVNAFALPLFAGAFMTMFDVGSDSVASTLGHTWIWEDGGGLFGVPWTNYLGWWFVTWTFFQVFTLVLARRQSRDRIAPPPAPVSFLQPVLVYLALGISSISTFVVLGDAVGTVKDATGQVWQAGAVYESMMIISVFGLLVVGLFALTKIIRGDLTTRR